MCRRGEGDSQWLNVQAPKSRILLPRAEGVSVLFASRAQFFYRKEQEKNDRRRHHRRLEIGEIAIDCSS